MKQNDKESATQLKLPQLATLSPHLDSEGLVEDIKVLSDGWCLSADYTDCASYQRLDGALILTATQSAANPHRVQWEMGVCVDGTAFGHALKVLRPGDLTAAVIHTLAHQAAVEADREVARWQSVLTAAKQDISGWMKQKARVTQE